MKKILVVLMSIIIVPFSITNFFYDYKIKKVTSGLIINKEKEDKIVRVLRNNTVENIELEDYLLSECEEYYHWEARILFGDYMTGLINSQDQVISEFTLALLEDSGWYKAN